MEATVGIALDDNFDITVGSTGDIERTQGPREVQKDLSVRVADATAQYIGVPQAQLSSEDVRAVVRGALEADERVQRVRQVAFETDAVSNRLKVSYRVDVDETTITASTTVEDT